MGIASDIACHLFGWHRVKEFETKDPRGNVYRFSACSVPGCHAPLGESLFLWMKCPEPPGNPLTDHALSLLGPAAVVDRSQAVPEITWKPEWCR